MKVIRIHRPNKDFGDIIAYFDIEVSGFRIDGFRFRRGDIADYVSYPEKQGGDKKWYPVARPIDVTTKNQLKEAIINALNDVSENKPRVESVVTHEKDDAQELTSADKIEISRKYLPPEWAPRGGYSGAYGE